MPELPEAEAIVRTLREHIEGKTLCRPRLNRTDIFRGDLRLFRQADFTRKVLNVARAGKRVVLRLDSGLELVFALGMTGRLTVDRSNQNCEPHTHLRLAIQGTNRELRFRDPRRFGGVWLIDSNPKNGQPTPSALGPDALSLRRPMFQRIMQRRRQIKALLLDQSIIAGMGNIYCDEALHRANLHPLARASELTDDQISKLLQSMRSVLRSAIRHNGSTLMDYRNANGVEGSFQRRHRVYNRTGKPCKTCGATIARTIVAGRSSHFCPVCQPAPLESNGA